MGNFSQKRNFDQNIDYISRTLNTLESYQYLLSLLRKTQNTFPDTAQKIFWLMGIFSQKGKYSPDNKELFFVLTAYII